jgi:Fe-S cluster biosynthesis and repair protein YggX
MEVVCARCFQRKPGLSMKPPGKYGQLILEQTCEDCWNEWRANVPRYINHYQLNLGIPEHRAELQMVMKEFLNLPD